MNKSQNFNNVREAIKHIDSDSFTMKDIEEATELKYSQTKNILSALEELGEIKFLQAYKIYVKINTSVELEKQ